MRRILILHGPNLNLLGEREQSIYGKLTLVQINQKLRHFVRQWVRQAARPRAGEHEIGPKIITLKIRQSNSEGTLIDYLHQYRHWADGVVINPGAYTHYSYAIRDAITAIQIPTVEVHLSAILKREKFRRISVISPVCVKQISGLGWKSYTEGIRHLLTQETQVTHV